MRGFVRIAAFAALLWPGVVAAGEFQSAYTDVDFDQCTFIESDDTGSMSVCPGWHGYPLVIAEGDLRMFVTYGVDPLNERAAQQTMPPFNSLGKKMEWRLEAVDGALLPRATILRWFTSTGDGSPDGQVLVVTQLKTGATCHIAYIDALAVKDANEKARQIADTSGDFDCTQEPEIVGKFGAWKVD